MVRMIQIKPSSINNDLSASWQPTLLLPGGNGAKTLIRERNMALLHAQAGEVVDIRPLGSDLLNTKTSALIKSANFEVIRMVLHVGKQVQEHRAKGEIIVQCLERLIELTLSGNKVKLGEGRLLHLKAEQPHALEAIEHSSVLLTLLLHSAQDHA